MAKTRLPAHFTNEGQRKLHVSGVRQSVVVERLDVSKATVSGWFAGTGKPGQALRSKLAKWLEISGLDWDNPPAGNETEQVERDTGPAPASVPTAPAVEVPVVRVGTPIEQLQQTLEDVRAEIAKLKRLTTDTKRPDIATLSNSLRNYLQKEADLVQKLIDVEQGWAESQAFLSLIDRIHDALAPIPGALDALEGALAYEPNPTIGTSPSEATPG